MVDFDKKKKIGDFALDFDKLDDLVNKIMEQLAPELPAGSDKPVVFGFSMRLDNSGKPVVEEFGNVLKKGGKPIVEKLREPLVDVQTSEKNVFITVELPGVEKKDLKINVLDQNTVEIVVAGNNSFYKKLSMPVEIKKEKANAKLKNGILEICFERLAQENKSEIKIN